MGLFTHDNVSSANSNLKRMQQARNRRMIKRALIHMLILKYGKYLGNTQLSVTTCDLIILMRLLNYPTVSFVTSKPRL